MKKKKVYIKEWSVIEWMARNGFNTPYSNSRNAFQLLLSLVNNICKFFFHLLTWSTFSLEHYWRGKEQDSIKTPTVWFYREDGQEEDLGSP